MSHRREHSRICRLIDESLRSYIESQLISITKENEKDLLIVLSQVLRKLQLLKSELDCLSDSDSNECSDSPEPHFGDHHCLTKIIADLVVFLTVESQFVRHSAGNVLVFVSEIVAISGGDWKCFIHLLCVCLELAISNTLSYPLPPSTTGAEELNYDITSSVVSMRPRLENANWFTVSSVIHVLRDILKKLKQEYGDQLHTAYLDCVSSCLANIPWGLLNEILVGPNCDTQRSSCNDSLSIFLGNLIQFFCSLVEQSDLVEEAGGSPARHQIVQKINNLIPEVLYWCLGNQGDRNNMCISPYFRHKLLMLMIRLSSQICLKYSILVSWLQLLHKYFQGLLLQPLTEHESGNDDCFEGSPFLLSLCDGEVSSMGTRHIQRQAIFLFLRCSFSLISLKEETDKHCACATWNSCSAFGLSSDLECCCKKKGLLELYEWLQGHLPSNMFIDYNYYKEKCINFARSFLQLYMHEDDILFEVLLQLCSIIPYCADKQLYKDRGTWKEVKEEILHHVSNIFNPICLFHLFLAELHYDHQVLLDYLISKDTGISCAEYLLRCLRIVCDSWHFFVEFSEGGKLFIESSCKKRKVILDVPNSQAELSSASYKGHVVALSLEEVCKKKPKHGSKYYTTREHAFKEAKECLLSLKSSVENLRQKNLFPYNPEVLLRRLRRFQELCL